MIIDEKIKKSNIDIPHNIVVQERTKVSITGVYDVESFDEHEVLMETSGGALIISGEELHVERLNLENNEILLEGNILSIIYSDEIKPRGSFLSRLFK